MDRIILITIGFLLSVSIATAETLEDAWGIAIGANNRLRSQGHRIEAAKAELQAARAARNPVLSNRTSYVALSDQPAYNMEVPAIPPILPAPMTYEMPLSDQSFALSATTVTVPIYTGGKISAAIDAGRHNVHAAHAGYSVSFMGLKLEVAEAYLNVLRARQVQEVTREAERSLFRHRTDVEKLLQQKIVTLNALLAAQTAHASAMQERIKADNRVMIAEAAYNRYMGRPLNYPVMIEELPVPPTSGDLEFLTDDAMRCRKELAQIAEQSKASASLSKVSHADRMPQVVAMGGHTYMQNSYLKEESYWSGAVGLQWTPLDGGASRARERVAMQNAAAACKMRDETRSLIELEVRAAWITEHETRSRIAVAEQGKRQANENLRVVIRQFQEGLVNHTEVLDAQTQQTAAAMNLCNARYDAILATYRLKRAIGML